MHAVYTPYYPRKALHSLSNNSLAMSLSFGALKYWAPKTYTTVLTNCLRQIKTMLSVIWTYSSMKSAGCLYASIHIAVLIFWREDSTTQELQEHQTSDENTHCEPSAYWQCSRKVVGSCKISHKINVQGIQDSQSSHSRIVCDRTTYYN